MSTHVSIQRRRKSRKRARARVRYLARKSVELLSGHRPTIFGIDFAKEKDSTSITLFWQPDIQQYAVYDSFITEFMYGKQGRTPTAIEAPCEETEATLAKRAQGAPRFAGETAISFGVDPDTARARLGRESEASAGEADGVREDVRKPQHSEGRRRTAWGEGRATSSRQRLDHLGPK